MPGLLILNQIIVILILFYSGCFRCFKHYYKEYICEHLKYLFPCQLSYNRFVELEKEVLLPITIFIKKELLGLYGHRFIYSTPLRFCSNQRILIHKTFEGIVELGKCSMGWFFGFKLHLIINDTMVRFSILCLCLKIWMTGNRCKYSANYRY